MLPVAYAVNKYKIARHTVQFTDLLCVCIFKFWLKQINYKRNTTDTIYEKYMTTKLQVQSPAAEKAPVSCRVSVKGVRAAELTVSQHLE